MIQAIRATKTFQSTHPTRGCDALERERLQLERISIHAPHEGVRHSRPDWDKIKNISIHAPHEGVRRG